MNRLIIVRHGGSSANEDPTFYKYNDSAICLTTNGLRQALNTAGILVSVEPRWAKPGNFAVEVFASQYTRAQQTARITLDQMGLLSVAPAVDPRLNERDYGTVYDPEMDKDPNCTANGSESSVQARPRAQSFLIAIEGLLGRSDVIAFSHFGTIRALIAEILCLDDAAMMRRTVDNGAAFCFERIAIAPSRFVERALPPHILKRTAASISPPPAAPPPRV